MRHFNSVKRRENSFINKTQKTYTRIKDRNNKLKYFYKFAIGGNKKYKYQQKNYNSEHKKNGLVLPILKLIFLVLIIVAIFRFLTNASGTMTFTELLNGLSSVPDIFTSTINSFKSFNEYVAESKLLDWFGVGQILSVLCSLITVLGYLIVSLVQLAIFVGYFAKFLFA